MKLKLDRLQRSTSVVDNSGLPSSQFQTLWQRTVEAVENSINDLTDILVRLGLVEVTAAGAQDLAQAVGEELGDVKGAPVLLQAANAKFANGYVLTSTATNTVGYDVGTITVTFSGNTDDVPEGANLYYTDDRARSALSSGAGMEYDEATGVIAVGATLAAYAGGDAPSAFILGIVDSADAAAFRAAIGAGTSSTTGTVTSVQASGGATGLTFSGGPVTGSGTLTLGGTLGIGNGGTGATTASGARMALGLGTLATQDVDNVAITGGSVSVSSLASSGPNAIANDRYSATAAAAPAMGCRRARGSAGSESPVLAGDALAGIYGAGWQTNSNTWSGNAVALVMSATEDYTSTGRGTKFELETTPNGSTTRRATLSGDQNGDIFGIAGSTSMTGGFHYVPSGAGAPSGTPTARTGMAPLYVDTTNNRLYVRIGAAWRYATLT